MNFNQFLDFELFSFQNAHIKVGNLFWMAVVLLLAWLTVWFIKFVIYRQVRRRGLDRGSMVAIVQLISYLVYTIALVLLLESLGLKISVLLAGSAALLVGIGLGLQQVFYDLVSGIILLFEGTIRVDDVVEINRDLVGRVKHIGLRTSKIETREDTSIIVPNSKFISGDVVNWSHFAKSTRFKVGVGVAYGSDVQLVKSVLLSVAQGHKELEPSPAPFVRFCAFGDSALQFELYFWTSETFGVENIKSDLRFAIEAKFREHGISIPYPQIDLHIKDRAVG